jgi:hypothetical protein
MPVARPASVQAPPITKEVRTPTPPPMTPNTTPVPTPIDVGRQRTEWTGKLTVPSEVEHEARPRSKVPLIIGAVVVAAAIVVALAVAGVFSKKTETVAQPSGSAPADAAVVVAAADAPPAPPPLPPPPAESVVHLNSIPANAEVIDLEKSRKLGRTPLTLKIPGSNTSRQFQFVLKGYSDAIIELTPNKEKLEYTEKLEKGVSGTTPVIHNAGSGSGSAAKLPPGPGSGSGSGSGSAVVTPPPPVKIDAGTPVDDCPELPCGIKDDPSRKKCKTNDDCADGKECVAGICKQ